MDKTKTFLRIQNPQEYYIHTILKNYTESHIRKKGQRKYKMTVRCSHKVLMTIPSVHNASLQRRLRDFLHNHNEERHFTLKIQSGIMKGKRKDNPRETVIWKETNIIALVSYK